MTTYEVLTLLFAFGSFLVTFLAVIVAIIAATKKK